MLLASGRGHSGAIRLYADDALYAGTLKAGDTIRQTLDGKPAYLVPARGRIEVTGDGGRPITAAQAPPDGTRGADQPQEWAQGQGRAVLAKGGAGALAGSRFAPIDKRATASFSCHVRRMSLRAPPQ